MDFGVALADTVLHLADFIAVAVDVFSLHRARGQTGVALTAVLVDHRLTNLRERE